MASNTDLESLAPWRDLLASCRVSQQVVTLANEFVSRLPKDDLLRLPEDCRPGFFRNGSDLSAYAVDVKSCRCHDVREAHLVEQIAAFFQDASQRLSVLTGPHRLLNPALWDRPADRA